MEKIKNNIDPEVLKTRLRIFYCGRKQHADHSHMVGRCGRKQHADHSHMVGRCGRKQHAQPSDRLGR